MIRTRRNAAAVVLGAVLPLSLLGAYVSNGAEPSAPPGKGAGRRLAIPRLSGPYAVGKDTRHLVDRERRDIWVPEAGARELMLSLYYPARAGGGRPTRYMTHAEAKLLIEGQKLGKYVNAEQLAATRTHARAGARPVAGKHPLVVLSPGFTASRATLTLLSEELASRGYVVALLDHAYETFGTSFPGGRTLTCVACETVESAPTDAAEKKMLAKAATNRAADVSYVVDELTGRGPSIWKHAALIDPKRIGAAGHSLGGNTAARTMATDPRVRAGANLDGTFFAPVPRNGLGGRPFLMLGTQQGHAPGGPDTTWDRDWRRLDGWKRWLTVADSGHFTFTDLPVLAGQLGESDPTAPLSGKRSGEITTSYVGAFFDHALRGRPRPLLDGPTAANPEVTFPASARTP